MDLRDDFEQLRPWPVSVKSVISIIAPEQQRALERLMAPE